MGTLRLRAPDLVSAIAVAEHVRLTQSPLGWRVLDNWQHLVARFVKMMPTDGPLEEARAG